MQYCPVGIQKSALAERVLVTGDDGKGLTILAEAVRRAALPVLVVSDSIAALDITRTKRPAVIVVAVTGPWSAGLAACHRLRSCSNGQIIVITTNVDVACTVRDFNAGVDLVLTPSWSDDHLGERLRAMLAGPGRNLIVPIRPVSHTGRARCADKRMFGPLRIDVARRQVTVADAEIKLTRTQFEILAALAERSGGVLSRQELLNAVWGPDWTGTVANIDVHIGQLRRKLGDNPAQPMLVLNVRGVGYRLAGEGWRY